MGATSANAIIYGAFDLIGVIQAGGTLDGNDVTDAFRRLQNMIGSLAIQPAMIPFIDREVFPLVAGKGGPTNPYSIGPGGDFNTSRPNDLEGAGLLMPATPQNIEIPRALLTDDGWEAIQVKDLSNQLFTAVYYNQTYAGGLGSINLWPVPNTTLYSLVLYRAVQLAPFSSLTATYIVPNGYDEMLEYNLAVRLAGPYKRTLPPYVQQLAVQTLADVKRANYKLTDLAVDPGMTTDNRRYGYNINTNNL